MVKMTPLFMFLVLSATKELFRGGCALCDSPSHKPVGVREGEMAVLQCPLRTTMAGHMEGNLTLAWSNHSGPGELQEPAVWMSDDTLVILRVSPNHQGSYSCSLLNASGQPLSTAWFNITVFSGQCYTDMTVYPVMCYLRQSCEKLTCTSVSVPQNFTNIIIRGTRYDLFFLYPPPPPPLPPADDKVVEKLPVYYVSYLVLPVYYLLLPVITCYYLLLPVITCYCLLLPVSVCLLPAIACYYLLLPVYYLLLPVITCYCLLLPVIACITCYCLLLPVIMCVLPVITCYCLYIICVLPVI
ncbi:unnamed protein product, partial [Oncorhynchus mykiss]